jgi:RNA ligase
MTFKKFPSIVQFSGVVKNVRDHCKWNNIPLPTLTFTGSAKIHGTNAGIGFSPDGKVWFQSRENIITYEKDNAGFATWGEHNLSVWKEIYTKIVEHFEIPHEQFYIFGEWYGASIQKGVAVAQLDHKKFGIFKAVFVTGEVETVVDVMDMCFIETYFPNVNVIDNIVPPQVVTINFENPQSVQNKLLELTLAVEAECPVGKYFGISGVGEGLVWSTTEVDWLPKFKTKGEKHSSSKVKTVRELTEAETTSKSNAAEFVEYALSENRLEQGIAKLGEMGLPVEIKSMGAYLKWVGNDILTEHHDTLVTSFIERKDVMPKIADKARKWFLNYINKEMGIV